VSSADGTLVVHREELEQLLQLVDPVATVEGVFRAQAAGRVLTPAEASMYWTTLDGSTARTLNMPGAIDGEPPIVGTKVINASLANLARGLPRASGVTMLFDTETATPSMIVGAGPISAARTAAVTLLCVELMGRDPVESIGIIGCGQIGRRHAELLGARLAGLREMRLYDHNAARARETADRVGGKLGSPHARISVCAGPEQVMSGADVVVACTTTTRGYVPGEWLTPGMLFVNVSLDDLKEDALLRADRIVVDSWDLVSQDQRRLLGRLYRAGTISGPYEPRQDVRRQVDAEVKDVLEDPGRGRTSEGDVVVANPFGIGALDIAFAHEIFVLARERDLGRIVRL
jgi:ornithine cyclodeaminase/alanine dehydrogenase-like protein (mu-crystallin family)